MYNSSSKGLLKKVFLLVALGVITIITLYGLTHGTVVIETDDTTSIKITKVGTNTVLYEHTGSGSFTTKPGDFTITISKKELSKQQNITIKSFSKQNVKLSILNDELSGAKPEPVMVGGLRSLFIDQQKIQYLTIDGIFSEVDKLKVSLPKQSDQASFESMQKGNNKLISIGPNDASFTLLQNGGRRSIALPEFSAPASESLSDNYSPDITYGFGSDNSLYVSIFGIVYKNKTLTNSYEIIYDSHDPYTRIRVAGSKIVIMHKIVQEVTDGNFDQGTGVTVIDISGKIISQNNNLSFSKLAVSPDGSKIAVLPQMSYDMTGTVYNTADLFKVVSKQNTLMTLDSFAWYGNTKLVYGSNGSIWIYDTENSTSKMLSTPVKNMSITNIIQPYDETEFNGYIYFNVLINNFRYIERVRIENPTQLDNYVYSLYEIFPATDRGCSYSFINFVSPIITASGGDYTTASSCVGRAPTFLLDNKIPAGKVTILPQ